MQFRPELLELVCGPIIANYPQCSLAKIEPDSIDPDDWRTWTASLELVPELYPILRHAQFEDLLNHNFADPLSGLLRAIKPSDEMQCRIQITIRPASSRRCHQASQVVKRLDREFFRRHHRLARYYVRHITRPRGWFPAWLLGLVALGSPEPTKTMLETSASRLHEREEDLQAASDKAGSHLFEAQLQLIVTTAAGCDREVGKRLRQMAGAFGAFTKSRLATLRLGPVGRDRLKLKSDRRFLLSHEELATLWHPPTATVLAEQMQTTEFTELEAPGRFYSGEEPGAVSVGCVCFRDYRRIVGIGSEDRRRHLYIVGKTEMGKTTLIQNMIAHDLAANGGVSRTSPSLRSTARSDQSVPSSVLHCEPDPVPLPHEPVTPETIAFQQR
ncbi:MAG: hypothetical protein WKF77_24240 [Planctomycetaceae bacterium]